MYLNTMRKMQFLLFPFIMLNWAATAQQNCDPPKPIQKIPVELLIQKADSMAISLKRAWKDREEMEKTGLIVDIPPQKEIRFEQNCSYTQRVKDAYHLIGAMHKNIIMRIRIVGNSDSEENKIDPGLSLRRAQFIKDIFVTNGIESDRIELFDANADRPTGPDTKAHRKANRRASFEIVFE